MFQKFKRRLVFLYGITSSIILTAIIIGVFFLNYEQNNEQKRTLFQKNVEQIVENIRTKNVISNTWISKVQAENNLLVLIEDNGKKLTNYSQLNTTIDMVKLIERIKELAIEEGINLNQKPLSSAVEKTSVYNLKENTLNSFFGMATLIPKDKGWQNIMVIYCKNNKFGFFTKYFLLFIFIDLIGIVALFLISSLYIGKVLLPLEEGQIKQNAFVAAASHELRSPLTVIMTGITSIREDISKADQFIPYIEDECGRMARLIDDMLLLAGFDSRTWSIIKEKVDMDTLLIESYDMFCTCFNKNNYQLNLNFSEDELHQIDGDRARIQQILTILMDNAMSYTPAGEIIVIRAYNQRNFVVVEVEDHGAGIREEDKKQVFERFYQGDVSRNEKRHFGLGLSIAKELIELHEGSITIKDTIGGGATFVVQIPW